ncbi:MAG: radical SAM family heme chaperone HemW [Deltaproteobacteria bacterium]|nr:radical SAM family heme chaperone HemW [Deltaproteobacteria bacterium]
MSDTGRTGLGLYVHIPFCRVKCPYCSFVVYAKRDHLRHDYVTALIQEMTLRAAHAREDHLGLERIDGRLPLRTLYLGGGTPSLLPPQALERILAAAHQLFTVSPDCEITVETEPGTTDADSFAALVGMGVNRVTIGAQSFDPAHLARLGRVHSPEDARAAVAAARSAGVGSLDLDLMFGLPEQTLASWQDDLAHALALEPDHLSLYNLTVEPETVFAQREKRGQLALPEEELQAAMMRAAIQTTEAGGLEHYEISNFARPGHRSRHNSGYWAGTAYLGVGVGAHGFAPRGGRHGFGVRSWNIKGPGPYIASLARGELPVDEAEELDRDASMLEALYLGLRQRGGLDLRSYGRRFGVDLVVSASSALESLASQALISIEMPHLKLTEDGVIIADYVISRLAGYLDTTGGLDTVKS